MLLVVDNCHDNECIGVNLKPHKQKKKIEETFVDIKGRSVLPVGAITAPLFNGTDEKY
jgi:hypothetical protein